jgi:hypothetical protein
MITLPPPTGPALAAPRTRALLTRFWAWADRRKARHLSRVWLDAADARWRTEYTAWWNDHGWLNGADNPDLAYAKIQAGRR